MQASFPPTFPLYPTNVTYLELALIDQLHYSSLGRIEGCVAKVLDWDWRDGSSILWICHEFTV